MHENSLEVNFDNIQQGKYPKQINDIVSAYKIVGMASMKSVSKYLRVPLNTISGRFKTMRDNGLIEEVLNEDGSVMRANRSTIYRLKNTI